MSRRGRRTAVVMSVLFGVVFGPILLLSWKDWHEILLLGVQHPSVLVEYVWNAVGPARTPTEFAAGTPDGTSLAFADYGPLKGQTSTPLASSAAFVSGTPSFFPTTTDDRSRPTGTRTLIPTRTPTRFVTRTPTLIGTRTATKIPTITPQTTLTLRPTPTHPPTLTPLPTETPEPTKTLLPTPTRTPRPPTRTPKPPTPTEQPTNPPAPTETEPSYP